MTYRPKSVDQMVCEWMLDKWLASSQYERRNDDPAIDWEVIEVDAGWDCSCYSSYTRDDQFEMKAILGDKNNKDAPHVEFTYGRWADFPDFIEQLEEYADKAYYCQVERNHD